MWWRCPDCATSRLVTHHRTEEIALCHYCDYSACRRRDCPARAVLRGHPLLVRSGHAAPRGRSAGAVPGRKTLPADGHRHDASARGAITNGRFGAFRSGKVRILLGTQMIAKGLDFPNVTLVGVINADTALHLPDFRAAERTFQLVTQVAGRTGRGPKGGRVLVQTFSPDHLAIRAAVRHNYETFASGELPMREMLSYPPFSSMIRLVTRGPVEPVVSSFAKHIVERLEAAFKRGEVEARVLGPAPCPFARLRGKYRFQIQVQAADGDRLRAAVAEATADLAPPDDVRWIVDVDPVDML